MTKVTRCFRRHTANLSPESEALLARMNTPANKAALKRAFEAAPQEMGRAAVAMAAKRGRQVSSRQPQDAAKGVKC